MKKVGPYTILNKMGDNAYEISLPPTLQISPIFNICDLTSYKGDAGIDIVVGPFEGAGTFNDQIFHDQEDYVTNLPQSKPVELEKILDSKILKQTRKKTYL